MLPLCHVQGTDGERAFLPFTFFATTAATTMVKNVPRSTAKRACQTLNQEIDFVQESFWKFMAKEFWVIYISFREIYRNILGASLPFNFFATTRATNMVKKHSTFSCQKTMPEPEPHWFCSRTFFKIYGQGILRNLWNLFEISWEYLRKLLLIFSSEWTKIE